MLEEALLTAAAAFLAEVELGARPDHSRLFVRQQPQSGEPPATAPASPENSQNQSTTASLTSDSEAN